MRGLELARRYYEEVARPTIARTFGDESRRFAVGLVGEGSECFGFDDEISRDHDWGPGFCIWLTVDDYLRFGDDLRALYGSLPKTFGGYGPRRETTADERTGVFEITDFYRRFIGYAHPPITQDEWRSIPEAHLATATNGSVFTDLSGEFTAFRQGLLAFYPHDVRLKKLAARCFHAGQAGQYNFQRSAARNEAVAAHLSLGRFMEAAASAVYLLNERYAPFYKWLHRGLKDLPSPGGQVHRLLSDLCPRPGTDGPISYSHQETIVEQVSRLIVDRLRADGLSDSPGDFLVDHAHSIRSRIDDRHLRDLPVMLE
jgi:hypothetical protein